MGTDWMASPEKIDEDLQITPWLDLNYLPSSGMGTEASNVKADTLPYTATCL